MLRLVPGSSEDSPAGLDPDAAALMADIDAFDLESARQRVQEIDARATGLRMSATAFPEAVPELIPSPPENTVEVETRPAAACSAAPAETPFPRVGGLLDQLKDEVADSQRRASEATQQIDAVRCGLDRRLRTVFEYFHDLTTQLNYLKPSVARSYYFLDCDDAFRNLSWLEGFADFRTQSERDGGHIERVTLGFTLKGRGERTFERSGAGVERLRQVLFDLGLRFECQERRNSQRELEYGCFTVADEISVLAVWRVDFERHEVVLETRNLERLGYARCTLSAEAIGPAMLDEFGRLILGRPNRFRSFTLR